MMKGFRVARNCIDAEELLVARCPCCSDIKLLLLDNQERIRAIGTLSLEHVKSIVADAEAGRIPAFNISDGNSAGLH
jgi:hypothetical protein